MKRSFNKTNTLNFGRAIESIDWQVYFSRHNNNCDILAEKIINCLINKFDICFPIKRFPIKTHDSKWVDNEVINLKSLYFDILNLKNKYPSNDIVSEAAENFSNLYRNTLRTKRKDFYSKLVRNSSNKSKSMWSVINTETGRRRRDRVDFTDLVRNDNGHPFQSKVELVNTMNREFASAAAGCGAPRADIPGALSALTASSPAADRCLRLKPFTPLEVYKILTLHIAPKSSTDTYGLSSKLMRQISPTLSEIMSNLFNACIKARTYPLPLKKVKISPLYKGKGKKSAIKSYRPISLIPCLSKVLEVGLNKRMLAFMTDLDIISERQYAYRAGRSTVDLVREVVWRVLEDATLRCCAATCRALSTPRTTPWSRTSCLTMAYRALPSNY